MNTYKHKTRVVHLLVTERGLLSLKVILEGQEWVLCKAHVGLPTGRQ